MDVAKYIGLFLLKNNFVYIHGLGNLEIKKKSATFDGASLQAPGYEVVLTPSGSIDDNLANFIANNEQVSISKASNALRDFSIQAKEALLNGKEVEIPSIGKFNRTNGKIGFATLPSFSYVPPGIPAVKIATNRGAAASSPMFSTPSQPATPPPYDPLAPEVPASKPELNWVRIGAVALGFVILILVIYFGVQYMTDSNSTKDAPLLPAQIEDGSLPPATEPFEAPAVTEESEPQTATGTVSYDVQLGEPYMDLGRATSRVDRLKSWGHKVEMAANEDSSAFYVVLPVRDFPVADTAVLMDSLRTTFRTIRVVD